MFKKFIVFFIIILILSTLLSACAEKSIMSNLTKEDGKTLLEMIDKKIDEKVPTQVPKWFSATVVSVDGGQIIVHLPTDPAGKNLAVQNPREISLEVGDEIYLVAINGSLSNAFVDVRKNIDFDQIYVDYTTGTDAFGINSNGDQYGSENAPFKTLQYAVNRLPKSINGRNIYIYYSALSPSDTLVMTKFTGGGYIYIQPKTGTSITLINYIYIYGCVGNTISIRYLGATNTASVAAIRVVNSSYISLDYGSVTAASSNDGIDVTNGSNVVIGNFTISNRDWAIYAANCSMVLTNDNAGTGNNYGLGAFSNATVGKSGTQPSGATAEYYDSNSIIR